MSDPPDRLAPVPREQLEILRATGAPITVGATGLAAADLFVDALRGEHVQRLVGELHLADIGIPPSVFRRLAIP